MSMRELVTGGAACAVPGSSSSSSNPVGAFANALIGSSSKTQGVLKEIPNAAAASPHAQFYPHADDPVAALPGSELDRPFLQSNPQGSEFIRGFRTADANGLADAWEEIQRQPHFDRVYEGATPAPPIQPSLDGPPQRVLSSFLHSFVDSSRSGIPLHPTPLPLLGLSQGDKQCIRDRSSIMARHIFADKSEEFINAQVNALLSSLEIENDIHARGPMPGRFRELEDYWNESQGVLKPGAHAADGWVTEFSQNRPHHGDLEAWAHSFEQKHGAGGWASEFEQEQAQLTSVDQMRGGNIESLAAIQQTRMLAHTLSQNSDPKFQNSKFLQFVSKMSRGELIIDDNQVKPASENWATEYQQQYNGGASWADEFVHDEVFRGPDHWANEFGAERLQQESVDDQWVNEFSKLHVDDWAEEFGRQVGEGALGDSSSDNWANSYDEFLNEQLAAKQRSDASRGVYVFSDMNPYVGHQNPLKEGQELFRKGLLSEAVLALEAEVMKNPENAEGWRLLGITHAENDDDQQAIAAMMRAQEADPTNLEVLLALGVSHTNELEQTAALKYLYGWLRHHPKYGTLAPPELANSLYYADVARLFNEAAQMSPEDADVHIVLGVLYNLSREYDKAIASFKTALKLKPNDYSLWNKLGATQANSVQSADAILAYQQFEWAWQHPQESAAVRQAAATFKSFSGVTNKIKLAYMMLALPPWQSLNITVNYFSTKYTNHSASCPSLPEQMKVKVSPMDELPFYTEPNEFECKDGCDNLDEYDEVSGTCETVPETYPNEVVIFSADNLHSIIHEACHEQSEHIEEYGTRKPGKSSDLGVGNVESLVFFHPPPNKATSIATGLTMVNAAECADMSIASKESLRGMRFKYAVEADEDPQPSVKEKPPTTVEEYEKLGDASTFGVYHRQPFSVICSPVRAYSSVVTSLSSEETAEGTNISIIEKECWIQKQLSAFVAASGDQQSWRKGKPLSTEVAVLKDHVPSFDVTREPEKTKISLLRTSAIHIKPKKTKVSLLRTSATHIKSKN